MRDYVDEETLKYVTAEVGDVGLSGNGLDAILTAGSVRRYLFDRDFSWEPRVPINW